MSNLIIKSAFNMELLGHAIDWLCECFDEDQINDLSSIEVMKGIEKHYSGGLDAFIKAGE